MKRVCKNVDPTNERLIFCAIDDCLRPPAKRRRNDTIKLFKKYTGDRNKAIAVLHHLTQEEQDEYNDILRQIAKELSEEIRTEKITLPKVHQEQRTDPSSLKTRTISILNIKQLLLDHIAVHCLEELTKRIGTYQVSAIKDKGCDYGRKAITSWLKNKRVKYYLKLDIKNFYGSIDRTLLINWLKKRIKNYKLLYLIETLISNIDSGVAIGSYLSQTLANIILSETYHAIPTTHKLFYMDDLLFLSTNKRKLKQVPHLVEERIKKLGLSLKPKYQIHKISDKNPIDMMGYRFSHTKVTIRKRIFHRMRRVILRCIRVRHCTLKQALRISSYRGYLVHSFSRTWLTKNKAQRVFHHCGRIIARCAVGDF